VEIEALHVMTEEPCTGELLKVELKDLGDRHMVHPVNRDSIHHKKAKNVARKLWKTIWRMRGRAHHVPASHYHKNKNKPWLGPNEEALAWSPTRIFVAKVVFSQIFEVIMSSIILLNLGMIIYEADYFAQCFPNYAGSEASCPFTSSNIIWAWGTNLTLLCIYTVEGFARIFVERKQYFLGRWNQMDAVVVLAGWFAELAGGFINLAFLRLIRVARLTRAFRIFMSFRELYLLINGIMSSMRAIFFGTIMLFGMLIFYGIVLVEWVHPYNSRVPYGDCEECSKGFQTVWYSVLTLFKQLIAGDSWIISFKLIDKEPWIAVLMIAIVVTISLGFMNLVLTVIVERAAEARAKDVQEQASEKIAHEWQTKNDLLKICAAMDTDKNGTLSMQELMDAYDRGGEFCDLMTTMDVKRDDIEGIFSVLDADHSGEVDYEEFSQEIIQIESHDQRVMLATRLSSHEIRTYIERNIENKLHHVFTKVDLQESKLNAIDTKIESLLGMRDNPRMCITDCNRSTETPEVHCSLQPRVSDSRSTCNSQDYDCDSLADSLGGVHDLIRTLAILETDLLRELEAQVPALLCHSELVANLDELLPREQSLGPGACFTSRAPMTQDQFRSIAPPLHRMKINIEKKLCGMLQQMQQTVSSVAYTLHENGQLLEEAAHKLGKSVSLTRWPCKYTSMFDHL